MTLYILGNGFDLNHDLKTSYPCYKRFIEDNLDGHKDWEIILHYYPKDYKFWNEAETYICEIDKTLFRKQKTTFGFTFLDDLFYQISESFNAFIISAFNTNIEKKFVFDSDCAFINFNYTSYLEDIYNIPRGRIIYLHNDLKGPILKKYFRIYSPDNLILGHALSTNDFFIHKDKDIKNDEEYAEFVEKTTKPYKQIIRDKRLEQFLKINKTRINKVVFFGFSFSKADKPYLQLLFSSLPTQKVKYYVYYHVGDKETDAESKQKLIDNIVYAGGDTSNMTFINCEGVTRI